MDKCTGNMSRSQASLWQRVFIKQVKELDNTYTESLLVHNPLGSFPGVIWNWPLYSEDREKPKKEVGHSALVDGSFNKQGNLQGLS